jgi:uncharacterized protein YjbI with pentapeptide repeats
LINDFRNPGCTAVCLPVKETQSSNASINFVGSRKGATGSQEDLKARPPGPKAWLKPELIKAALTQLELQQAGHSSIDLAAMIERHFYDADQDRYRCVWSKNMITAAGVSQVKTKKGSELLLHFRDGKEEASPGQRWMRQILEGLYGKGGRGQETVTDFFMLTLVHEASEMHQRKQAETLKPSVKAEIRAEIEEAKAYLALSASRRKSLQQLYGMLDETCASRKQSFSAEIELFEKLGEDGLGTIEGLLALIDFVLEMPDYRKKASGYPDERARLQLAKSLFVDVLHDFAGASRADKWVRKVESAGIFSEQPPVYDYSEKARQLSDKAEEVLKAAAGSLQFLVSEDAGPEDIPGRSRKKRAIDNFNARINKLDEVKSQLPLNEVLSIPTELKQVLEDNRLNQHFSYMDDVGIYHSLNLSRLDLRGLNLNSGADERNAADRARETNQHKDKRADLRGAHIVGSDLSGRANFAAAKLDFALFCYSDLREIICTGARAIGTVLYGANASEAQFERANMKAVDARGMSASFARVQMEETDINGMKIWQSDIPSWQRAYVDISRLESQSEQDDDMDRDALKEELDFLDDSFLDELSAVVQTDNFQGKDNWIELREKDGQLEFLKGRGVVFYSRDEVLEYSLRD